MNMKSMMFAGLGLTVAMTATVIWMKEDVKHMRDVRLQQQAAECARLAQRQPASTADTTGAAGGTTIQQFDSSGAPIATAAPEASGADCPTTATTATGAAPGTTAIDPMTGQALVQDQPLSVDPNAAAAQYDPNTSGQYDPATSAQYDPNASSGGYGGDTAGQYDPNTTGQYDPNAASAGQYDPTTANAQPAGF